jgi:hypothetical protein
VDKSAKIDRKYKLRDNRRAEDSVLEKNNFKNEINKRNEIFGAFNISIGAHPASCKMDTGSFPGVESG